MSQQVIEKEKAKATPEGEILKAAESFYSALQSVFKGDLEPMSELWSHEFETVLMDPFGATFAGWEAIQSQFDWTARQKIQGRVSAREQRVFVSGEMAWRTCVECTQDMTIDGEAVQLEHRATTVYRRIDGRWLIVVHHTDRTAGAEASTTTGWRGRDYFRLRRPLRA